jgi:hypothetical protein
LTDRFSGGRVPADRPRAGGGPFQGVSMRLAPLSSCLILAALLAGCEATVYPEPSTAALEEAAAAPYDFPFIDPFVATVVGTPPGYQAPLPAAVPRRELEIAVLPGRQVPQVLWYEDNLRASLVHQEGAAPLVFIIAGTGAAHDSQNVRIMERALYQGGFHVISLPSPTHPNFVVTASTSGIPGRISEDAPDLYRAMRLAYDQVSDEIEVSSFHLTGYSLGGWQAAFVADLDERERVFGFEKVLLINPPVSLYSSMRILDHLLEDNIPGGLDDGFDSFFNKAFEAFYDVYRRGEFVSFSDDFLYRAWLDREPTDEDLRALVGLSFRLSSTNMIFVADVVSDSGYIVPRGRQLTVASSLTDYFKTGARLEFENYLDELLLPHFKAESPGLTRDDLVREADLASIEDYLRRDAKIGLMTNEDDIILAPGEIEYLEEVFGTRAQIYPTGGHLGNLRHPRVLADMIAFFRS